MLSPTLAAARRAKDTALGARVIAEPEEAILAAWRRFRPLVRQILRKMLGSGEDTRDLCQEAFLQFHRSVAGLRSPEAIRSFVGGIAVRLALEELRRRRVRGRQVLVPGQAMLPLDSINADPEAREAMAHLLHAVGQLRAGDRDLFVLRQVRGLEQAEISAATHLSISTVRRRLLRLQRRLAILVNADPALAPYARRGGLLPARRSSVTPASP